MKFSDMKYERVNVEEVKNKVVALSQTLKNATSFEEAKSAFLEMEKFQKHVFTMGELVHIRHSIDTRDEFYDEENKFWNKVIPEMEQYVQMFKNELLNSKYRKELSDEYGEVFFINMEIQKKTFSPEIIPELQEENRLVNEYDKLLASAEVKFEDKTYTLSQMSPFKNDFDDERRLKAWIAEGEWYMENADKLDSLYDNLVKVRSGIAKKLGYDNFIELGYYRMTRNCYDQADVDKFRQNVVKYIVPMADELYKEQAKRLSKEYPMNFADNALEFRTGNPKPQGTAYDIIAHGRKFYDELSPETSKFYRTMLNMELMDVLSKEGKQGGGYCTPIFEEEVPFIFANFNGTQHDVEVVTHEAGHAFAVWMNKGKIPMETTWPTYEACEVHSMSMEFFAWPWAEGFFGKDTKKFKYSHLASAIKFIPYGTMVDHFQHLVYENPDLTPEDRHEEWKRLMNIYMPWVKIDGDIPFYDDARAWQRQSHIYDMPFYYIDYCLAQTVALQFWAMMKRDMNGAWDKYMSYTKLGGSLTFIDLLKSAGLQIPFEEECLKGVSQEANKFLSDIDTSEF